MLYDDVIQELNEAKCFIFSKKKSDSYYRESSIFFIKGTRYLCHVDKISEHTRFTPPLREKSMSISWFFKTKKFKSKYKTVTFEEILESPLVSNKAKTELLFHLDLFRE